jgi:hypothetical protein
MKINKFLNQYPQLWEPTIGDKIIVIQALTWNKTPQDNINLTYQIGEQGTIINVSGHNIDVVYRVHFSNFSGWLYKEEMELYYED